MVTKKETKQDKTELSCTDKFCPIHGKNKLKLRGRVFEGIVVKKLNDRVSIQFERMFKIKKYESFEKRKTKIHARLPDCMKHDLDVGDLIEVSEVRPLSKTIHFVVTKVIRRNKE